MIIQCYVNSTEYGSECGVAYIERHGRGVTSVKRLQFGTDVELSVNTIIEAMSKFQIEHFLFVTKDCKYTLRKGILDKLQKIGIVVDPVSIVTETYPNDFTKGSATCLRIEDMITKLEDQISVNKIYEEG